MIDIKNGTQLVEDVRMLFREYSKIKGAEKCFISFEKELAELPGQYAEPDGMIRVAYENELPIGCIALKPITDKTCEIKRLFLKEEFRKSGYGYLLLDMAIQEAKNKGYKKVILETLPIMEKAIKLYQKNDFQVENIDEDGIIHMYKEI